MGKRAVVKDIVVYTGLCCKYAKNGEIWQASKVCSSIDGVYFKNYDVNTSNYRLAKEEEIKWFKRGIKNINDIPYVGMVYKYHSISGRYNNERTITNIINGIIYTDKGNNYIEDFIRRINLNRIIIINKSNTNKNNEENDVQREVRKESSRSTRGKYPIFGRQEQVTNGSRPVGNKIAVKIKGARIRTGALQGRVING